MTFNITVYGFVEGKQIKNTISQKRNIESSSLKKRKIRSNNSVIIYQILNYCKHKQDLIITKVTFNLWKKKYMIFFL